MSSRTDKVLRVLTGLTVAGLAIVAGAISFAHMTELAIEHGQTGWKAYAFPISVDGLEIVASLYLVAQRRAGRPTGWIPWVALVVGTAASLAANVAVGGHDPIGKALAGWPALSMLVAVKLLFSMIDHNHVDQRTVPDDQRSSADRPAVPGTVLGTGPDGGRSSRPTPDGRTGAPDGRTGVADRSASRGAHAGIGPSSNRGSQPGPADLRSVAHLLPAARQARGVLESVFGDALDADVAGGFGRSQFQCRLALAAYWFGAAPCRWFGRPSDGLDSLSLGATDRPVLRGRLISAAPPSHIVTSRTTGTTRFAASTAAAIGGLTWRDVVGACGVVAAAC